MLSVSRDAENLNCVSLATAGRVYFGPTLHPETDASNRISVTGTIYFMFLNDIVIVDFNVRFYYHFLQLPNPCS